MKKFVVSGGGTGGHIYPALAIIRGLQKKWPDCRILYIGSAKGIEKEIVTRQEIPFASIDINRGINRSHLVSSVLEACRSVPASFLEARKELRAFRPDAVIGTGGYVSFPVLSAAEWLKIPAFIHEQNAWPGITNRLLARRAAAAMLTFEEARLHLKARRVVLTGLPVRPEILEADRAAAKAFLQLDDTFTLLIFGGSLGAASINRATEEMLPDLKDSNLQILWITGNAHYEAIHQQMEEKGYLAGDTPLKLRLYPYLYEMDQAMAASDLAVCRCGAATLSELEIMGLPAVLIPYPYATENHQEKNGLSLAQRGAGILIRDEALNGGILRQEIEKIRQSPENQQRMKQQMKQLGQPDSLKKIIAEIERGMLLQPGRRW